ncbi:MAG: OmpA family protein [Thermonemataceae bacterium]
MRYFTLVALVLCFAFSSQAQTKLEDRVKNKSKRRGENKVDRTIDNGLNKVEQGFDGLFKKKKKKKDKNSTSTNDTDANNSSSTGNDNSSNGAQTDNQVAKTALKSYSKYDFIPGEKVIAYEDFSQDAIGDFPAKWNTNSSAEIVTLSGQEGKWLQMNGKGVFYPEFVGDLPENFTLEYNMASSEKYSYYCPGFDVNFVEKQDNYLKANNANKVYVGFHPYRNANAGHSNVATHGKDRKRIIGNGKTISQLKAGTVARISIWRQKTRLRVYINEVKVWDLPRAYAPETIYRLIFTGGGCEGSIPYISDMSLAVGKPDTRSKLITEGKFVTRGILFDVNSDKIKGESYGTLKDIAQVLSENPTVRVKIIGHTDADGEEQTNLQLSQKRAEAVKQALSKEFNITTERMETSGKGESEPVDSNDTAAGKANNRRVEFVKL